MQDGTVVFPLGPNGAGKTTIVRMLATVPASGCRTGLGGGHDVGADAAGAGARHDRGRARWLSLDADPPSVPGWSPQLTVARGLELFGLMLLGMFAFTWAGVRFGMLVRSPDAMQGVGFIVILPLTFAMALWCLILRTICVPLALRRLTVRWRHDLLDRRARPGDRRAGRGRPVALVQRRCRRPVGAAGRRGGGHAGQR